MPARCKDILKLPSMKNATVAAGHNALDRIVRWVHLVDIPEVTQWVLGGELLFITGIGIRNATELVELIKAIESKRLAGLVINVGPYIKEISLEAIALANSLNFPIITLPWETKLVDVTHDICNYIITKQLEVKSINGLLDDILFGSSDSMEEILERVTSRGFDIKKSYITVVISLDNNLNFFKKNQLNDEKKVLEFNNYFLYLIFNVFSNYNMKCLQTLQSNSAVFVIPVERKNYKKHINNIILNIKNIVIKQFPSLIINIGLGRCYNLNEIKKGYHEAKLALKAAKAKVLNNNILSYDELGVLKLILTINDQNELTSFYNDILKPLIEYDKHHGSNFVETLEMYFSEDRNLKKTAENLHVHCNTLKYRLKRLEEISGLDLKNSFDCLSLQAGLIIGKLINLSDETKS